MKVGVVYGTSSGAIRRVIVAEDESNFDGHLMPGESLVLSDDTMLLDGMPLMNVAESLVAQEIGREALSSRCVVLDESTFEVISIVLADPALDTVEGGIIIRDAQADIGWTLETGQAELTPPVGG